MKEGSPCILITFTLLNHNGALPCYDDDGDDDDDHGGDDQNDGDQIVPRCRGYHASEIMTCNTKTMYYLRLKAACLGECILNQSFGHKLKVPLYLIPFMGKLWLSTWEKRPCPSDIIGDVKYTAFSMKYVFFF